MAEGKSESGSTQIARDTITLDRLSTRHGLDNASAARLVKAIVGLSGAGVGTAVIIAVLTGGSIAP